MGTYLNTIDKSTVNKAYIRLLGIIKNLKCKRDEYVLSYFIICLYEYLIMSICIRYRDEGKIVLRENIKKGTITINITDVYKCFNANTNAGYYLNSLMVIANSLRHSYYNVDDLCNDFMELNERLSMLVLEEILTDKEVQLKDFLQNIKLLQDIYNEIFNSKYMQNICDGIVNGYVKNSSGNRNVEYIINEMISKSGCSLRFACLEFVKCTRKEVIEF